MYLDELYSELRDQHIRGPLMDEIIVHIRLHHLVIWQDTPHGTLVRITID